VDPTLWVSGVVASDRSRALYALAFVGRSDAAPLGRITLRGLDDARRYRVTPSSLGGPQGGERVPPWYEEAAAGRLELTGRALRTAGLQAPLSHPDRVWLLQLEALDRP